jgi:ribosomal protein S18 acetylase RimI-like enzyme
VTRAPRRGAPRALAAVHPLTSERFADLEALFGEKGCSLARACWCMFYREVGRPPVPQGTRLADFRKAGMRRLAARGELSPGLIGYDPGGRPLGWVTLGPHEAFAKLQRSPVMKPVDNRPVWSVPCFVVPSASRGRGVATALLRSAMAHARANGAAILEGYPVDKPQRAEDQWMWHGAKRMFDRAGFTEVARRKPERPIMRLALGGRRRTG